MLAARRIDLNFLAHIKAETKPSENTGHDIDIPSARATRWHRKRNNTRKNEDHSGTAKTLPKASPYGDANAAERIVGTIKEGRIS